MYPTVGSICAKRTVLRTSIISVVICIVACRVPGIRRQSHTLRIEQALRTAAVVAMQGVDTYQNLKPSNDTHLIVY